MSKDPIVEKILEMYKSGMPISAIVAETGRSRTTIYHHLNYNNVPLTRNSAMPPEIGPLMERIEYLNDQVRLLTERAERAERLLDRLVE